jgi:RNA polymerase primary sigma factor
LRIISKVYYFHRTKQIKYGHNLKDLYESAANSIGNRYFLAHYFHKEVSKTFKDYSLNNTNRDLFQTLEDNKNLFQKELAKEMDMDADKIEYILKIKQDITSLDAGIGRDGEDGEDSTLGDFIEDEDTASPEESASGQLLKEQVREILSSLSDREQKIIEMRFGLNGTKSHTLEEVGLEFAVTRERIRQIEAKALMKLRKHKDSKKLHEYLD